MSLPIEESALAAQSKAEHEYGERLMDLATERVTYAGRALITADDIEWAVGTWEHEVRHGESLAKAVDIGPQRATPASPAQLKAIASQVEVAVRNIDDCNEGFVLTQEDADFILNLPPLTEEQRKELASYKTVPLRCICAEKYGAKVSEG
jgi:hypothetical protein